MEIPNVPDHVTLGAGVQWLEAYGVVNQYGRVVVGGSSGSVGAAGGWLQGGDMVLCLLLMVLVWLSLLYSFHAYRWFRSRQCNRDHSSPKNILRPTIIRTLGTARWRRQHLRRSH